MSRRTKLYASLAVLGIALAVALGFAVVGRRTVPVSPTEVVPPNWQTARKTPMHEVHIERGKVACAKCHTAGFDEKPSEATCTGCHEQPAAHAHRGDAKAPTTCLTCHAFAAGKTEPTCVGCHGATAGAPANGNGSEAARAAHALARHVSKDAACNACHNVHGDKAAKTRTALADCTACHTSVKVEHGRVAAAASGEEDAGEPFDAAVMRFASDSRASTTLRDGGTTPNSVACAACHAPHTTGVQAREACAKCHVGGDGARAHGSEADAKSGAILVASFAPRIEPRGKHVAGHAACVTCHEPHRAEKIEVRRCEECHADHRGAITASAASPAPRAGATGGAAGHTACTGCHTPHAPAEAKASCANAGCHEGKVALAAPRVAAHAACESCHDPHKPTASPALACARCHGDVQPKHPQFVSKTAGASTCIGCHAPHGGSASASAKGKTNANAIAPDANAHASAQACSSCHTKAHGDRGFHAGGVACVACHKPHDFASHLIRNAAGGPAHGMPAPAAKAEEAALCASCHAPKTAAVSARPGHAECGACHGAPHSPVKKPACATCHAQETATALPGHNACAQCHDSHSGSLGTHAVCTSCHADKSKQQHGAIAGGCANCHAPHGPKGVTKPPACTTCHATPTLDGLHSVAAHNTSCASCHGSHSAVRSDRATCTSSCHVDRRDHQPAAKVCKGCHMFRK